MIKFAAISKYKNAGLPIPARATAQSAGYDLAAAEDIIIPSYLKQIKLLEQVAENKKIDKKPIKLSKMKDLTKIAKVKPTLISTGMKCYMEDNQYLKIVVRSSTPLKYWLILANSEAIIDADYVDNSSNEGEIYLQFINLSPLDIQIKKGDVLAQGIICTYETTDDDAANQERQGGFGSTS